MFESFEAAVLIQNQIRAALPARSGYGLPFIICHDDEIVERDMTLELGCLVEVSNHTPVALSNDLRLTLRQLPAIPTMAIMIVTGALEVIHARYGEMGQWMENNGYRLAGNPREIVLKPARSLHRHDLVTEIQFPVEPLRHHVE